MRGSRMNRIYMKKRKKKRSWVEEQKKKNEWENIREEDRPLSNTV